MLRSFLLCCALALTFADSEDFRLCFKGEGKNSGLCMIAEANVGSSTIYYRMDDSSKHVDMETLEDYIAGYGASRVVSQQACIVRHLQKTYTEKMAYLRAHDQTSIIEPEKDFHVTAVPVDHPEEVIGAYLTTFCGELPIYKMVKKQE